MSENALLPGQVHTYFGGSEHSVFRAYRHEVAALADKPADECGTSTSTSKLFPSASLTLVTGLCRSLEKPSDPLA